MKSKRIFTRTDPSVEGTYLDIKDFGDMVDVTKVVYYHLTTQKNGTLKIVFLDKNKKRLKRKKS